MISTGVWRGCASPPPPATPFSLASPLTQTSGPDLRAARATATPAEGGGSGERRGGVALPRAPPSAPPRRASPQKIVDASGEVAAGCPPPAGSAPAGVARGPTAGAAAGGEGPAPPRGAGRGPGADAPGSRVCRVEDNAWLTRQGPRQVLSSRVLEPRGWIDQEGQGAGARAEAGSRARLEGGAGSSSGAVAARAAAGIEAAVASRETRRRGRPSYTSAQGGGGWRRKRRMRLWHSAKAEEQGLPAPRRHVRPCVAHLPTPVRKKGARRAGVGWFRDSG